MSEAKETRTFSYTPQEVINLARAVAEKMKYEPERLGHDYAKFKERGTFLLRMVDRGTIEVSASPSAEGAEVAFRCANFGSGPLRTGQVRGQLKRFLAQLEGEMERSPPGPKAPHIPGGGGQPEHRPSGGGAVS